MISNFVAKKLIVVSLMGYFVSCNHRYIIEVDCSLGQFKSAILEDKEYTIDFIKFFHNIAKKKEIDAPSF